MTQTAWVGADGNLWINDAIGGVRNAGSAQGTGGLVKQIGGTINAPGGFGNYTMIADPNPPKPANTSAGAGVSSGGAANTNAADLAYLDDQENLLRGMLTSADKTKANGLTQIDDDYNKEMNRTKESQAAADAKYDTQREDTTRAKSGAIGSVNTGARTLSDSVRRMLGMAGGTNSSAFNEAAPNMIARDTTQKRTNVIDTFGRNFRDIDTADASTESQFKNYIQDLSEQRRQKQSGLEEGVLTQQQTINQNLGQLARDRASLQGGNYSSMRAASAPYQSAAANSQSALDSLFEKYRTPYQTQTIAANTPTLADYTVDKTQLAAGGGAAGGVESPYQQYLKKKFADTTA